MTFFLLTANDRSASLCWHSPLVTGHCGTGTWVALAPMAKANPTETIHARRHSRFPDRAALASLTPWTVYLVYWRTPAAGRLDVNRDPIRHEELGTGLWLYGGQLRDSTKLKKNRQCRRGGLECTLGSLQPKPTRWAFVRRNLSP